MMQTVKLIVLGLLAVFLIILGVANMAAVDLYLLPAALFGDGFSIRGIPLAVVILAAVLAGFLAGLVIEFMREHKQRRVAEEKRREIVKLRQEVARLRAKLGDHEDELPLIPAA
ncbi:MAG: lipopolysaccharide assembly protein LapA domain-containing protein [Alphaproteobacteria bacterium]